MSLLADELQDLEMDTDNRQVFVDDTGDLSLTSGLRTVEQSIAISAGDVLRPLIGQPIRDKTFRDIEAELQRVLNRDLQIDDVQRVNVTQVDRTAGTVFVEIVTPLNNTYEIEVTT